MVTQVSRSGNFKSSLKSSQVIAKVESFLELTQLGIFTFRIGCCTRGCPWISPAFDLTPAYGKFFLKGTFVDCLVFAFIQEASKCIVYKKLANQIHCLQNFDRLTTHFHSAFLSPWRLLTLDVAPLEPSSKCKQQNVNNNNTVNLNYSKLMRRTFMEKWTWTTLYWKWRLMQFLILLLSIWAIQTELF